MHKNTNKQLLLSKNRKKRLRQTQCILGQPDLVCITRVRKIKNFLNNKIQTDYHQFFIVGVNLVTTAHLSIFINNLIKQKFNSLHSEYHIQVFIYDAFEKIDVQVQILIPGSISLKATSIHGNQYQTSKQAYTRAYYSSVLRSFYRNRHHSSTILRDETKKYTILKQFISDYIPFCCQNFLDKQRQQKADNINFNIGLQILIQYFKEHNYQKLLDQIYTSMQMYPQSFQQRRYILKLQLLEYRQNYEKILYETAKIIKQKKLGRRGLLEMKQFQLKGLLKLNRFNQARILLNIMIKQGLRNKNLWYQIVDSYDLFEQESELLKCMNIGCHFVQQSYFNQIKHRLYPQSLQQPNKEIKQTKLGQNKISNFTEFCFTFDDNWLQKYSILQNYYQKIKQKDFKKSQTLLKELSNVKIAMHPFEDQIITLQKKIGWQSLLEIREQVFWIQKDFYQQTNDQSKNAQHTKYHKFSENKRTVENQCGQVSIPDIKQEQQKSDNSVQQVIVAEQSFSSVDANFSIINIQKQQQKILQLNPCSHRIVIGSEQKFKVFKKQKILCHSTLQNIFINIYDSLKVQNYAEKWCMNIKIDRMSQETKQKRYLIAYIFYQKALLHKKLRRFKKCEQSLQIIQKISPNIFINLVSLYKLGELYCQHKVVKGVQKCLERIVKILYQIGIHKYDIIPQWAQKWILFLFNQYGTTLWKKAKGPLLQMILLWSQASGQKPMLQQNQLILQQQSSKS